MDLQTLRDLLAGPFAYLPGDTKILMSNDEEGNIILPLAWVGAEKYVDEPYCKDVQILHPDDVPSYEEDPDYEVKVGLSLWP